MGYETIDNSILSTYNNLYFHVPIKIEIDFIKKIINTNQRRSFINERANCSKYKQEVETKIETLNKMDKIEDFSDKLMAILVETAKNNIPVSKESKTRILELPPNIKKLIKLKNKAQRKFKKTRNNDDRDIMYELIRKIKSEINEVRRKSWKNFLEKLGPSPLSTVPFWRRINRFRNKKNKGSIGELEKDGVIYKTNEEKSELFAERLKKVFRIEEYDVFDQEFKEKIHNQLKYNKLLNKKIKYLPEIILEEVKRELKSINKKTSKDSFGMTNLILKNSPDKVAEKFRDLFNAGIFLKELESCFNKHAS